MRKNTLALLISAALLLSLLVSGCATRQLTSEHSSALDAIAAKIAEAEAMGAVDCAPQELARAKAVLDHARHEVLEHGEAASSYLKTAEMAADKLLAKTSPCWEALQKKLALERAASVKQEVPETLGDVGGQPEMVRFAPVYFDYDQSIIRDDAKPGLQEVAAALKAEPALKLVLEGHCDERGTAEYNVALGERRAAAAMRYLKNLGVEASRLTTLSYGEERPVALEQNEAAWAKNRRVEFIGK